MWWFDFFGYNYVDPVLMGEVKDTMDVRHKIKDIDMQKISEIAIFTDSESEFYLNQDSDIDDVNKSQTDNRVFFFRCSPRFLHIQ